MLFWLMGDLGYAQYPLPALLVLATMLIVAMPLAQAMNVLALGRIKAQSLGWRYGTEVLLIWSCSGGNALPPCCSAAPSGSSA